MVMNIQIANLTARQHVFADIIWNLQGEQEVQRFIKSLPPKFRADADIVVSMMVAAVFDELTDTAMAEELLQKYNK